MAKKVKEDESDALLWPILDKDADLRKEFRNRNSIFDQKKIKPEDLDSFVADGWIVHKRLKGSIAVRRQKKIDERLENLWWILLYKGTSKNLHILASWRFAASR